MSVGRGRSGGVERVGHEYRMPSLGADMTRGRVVEWLVEPGDLVHRGDVVGVVDTDKGAIEMEIWEDAVVEEIVVPPGRSVPVGEVLLRLRPPEDEERHARERFAEPPPGVGRVATQAGTVEAAGAERAARAAPPPAPVAPGGAGGPRASPAARRRARALGLSLEDVRGSGPDGAVVLADVERLASPVVPPGAAPAGTPARRWPEGEVHATPLARQVAESLGVDLSRAVGHGPGGLVTRADVEALTGSAAGAAPPRAAEAGVGGGEDERDARDAMRRAIAAAMARSKREIPHYYLSTSASLRRALDWLAQQNRDRPPEERILVVSLFVKAVAVALRQVPELNGHWVDGGFRRSQAVHAGLAVSLRGGGLIAPALREADGRSVTELSKAVLGLVNRARSGRLRSSELTDSTITVSSMGDRGVDMLFGIVYPPQVALVGVGRIAERPWAEGGMLGVHPVVELTLSADHRASDGHRGGVFLQTVVDLLQHPEEL